MKIQYIILIILYVAITIIYADDCCYEELDLKYKLKRLASSCQGKSQTVLSGTFIEGITPSSQTFPNFKFYDYRGYF